MQYREQPERSWKELYISEHRKGDMKDIIEVIRLKISYNLGFEPIHFLNRLIFLYNFILEREPDII